MNKVTFKELKSRAADYASVAIPAHGSIEDTRLNEYVNDGLSNLWDILVGTYDEYICKTATISIKSGQEAYDLPDDFYKVLKVFQVSSGRRYPIDRFGLDDLSDCRVAPIGNAETELWYIPQAPRMINDDESVHVSIPVGWDTFIVLHAAIQWLSRLHVDTQNLVQERELCRARLINMAEPRDSGMADSIGDVYNKNSLVTGFAGEIRYRVIGNNIRFINTEVI